MKLCLMTQFKNERHALYEFINHYILEGVDYFLLIDDGSNDDYYNLNNDWLEKLIKEKKVDIYKNSEEKKQIYNFNHYLKQIQMYDRVIICDMDEFMFSVSSDSTIKSVLETNLSGYDLIYIPWKMFNYTSYFQPKSIIDNNITTHTSNIDISVPSFGYKYIACPKKINTISIHSCSVTKNSKIFKLENCHNNLIQNNHYRFQSEEFFRGLKESRGGGFSKKKYFSFIGEIGLIKECKSDLYYIQFKNIPKTMQFKRDQFEIIKDNKVKIIKPYSCKLNICKFDKYCNILKLKRKNLIEDINKRLQIRPLIDNKSSFLTYQKIIKLNNDCGLFEGLRTIFYYLNSFEEINNLVVICNLENLYDYFDNIENLHLVKDNINGFPICYNGNGNELNIASNSYKKLKLNSKYLEILKNKKDKFECSYIAIHVIKNENYEKYDEFINLSNKRNLYIVSDNKETFTYFLNKYKNSHKIEGGVISKKKHLLSDVIIDLYMCIYSTEFLGFQPSLFTDFISDNRN